MLADGEYDAIVMGTGLKEAIMSGLLSTLGMKVNPVCVAESIVQLPCARWPCCSVAQSLCSQVWRSLVRQCIRFFSNFVCLVSLVIQASIACYAQEGLWDDLSAHAQSRYTPYSTVSCF